MPYEKLLQEAYHHEINIYEKAMPKRIKGLYADNVIWLNKNLSSTKEKACILAEELGHYHTTSGNILNQSDLYNRKQEKQARSWAYKKLIPLSKLIDAFHCGVQNQYELAEYLNVTEDFLLEALKRYKEEYGTYKTVDRHTIFFEPLTIIEMFID